VKLDSRGEKKISLTPGSRPESCISESPQLPVFQGGHPTSTNRARCCLAAVIEREPIAATPRLNRYYI